MSYINQEAEERHTHARGAGWTWPKRRPLAVAPTCDFEFHRKSQRSSSWVCEHVCRRFSVLSFNCTRNSIFCACARTGSDESTRNYRLQQVITSNYLSWRLFLAAATVHSNLLMKYQIRCNRAKCRHDQQAHTHTHAHAHARNRLW
jgi:hypothetical protein